MAAAHLEVLQLTGGQEPPGSQLEAIPKENWNYPRRDDWMREPFAQLDWKVPAPGGPCMEAAPLDALDTGSLIGQPELLRQLDSIAKQGQQDANHEHVMHYVRFCHDMLDTTHWYEMNLGPIKDNEAFINADLAGVALATILDLQQKEAAVHTRATKEAHKIVARISAAPSARSKENETLKKELLTVREEAASTQWAHSHC